MTDQTRAALADALQYIALYGDRSNAAETHRQIVETLDAHLRLRCESAAPSELTYSGWVWRHIKTGREYQLIGEALLQCTEPLSDMADVYLYRGEDGKCWVRSTAEFDAKFERVRPLAPPAAPAEPTPAPAEGGTLALAVIGLKHFGNPIPKEWYAAAKELLASPSALPVGVSDEATLRKIWNQVGEPGNFNADFIPLVRRIQALAATPEIAAPIDMVLHCPKCGLQHIDGPEGQFYPGHTAEESTAVNDAYGEWKNPPHRSHLCHGCSHIWRPADVPTNGVAAVKTVGKADSPIAAPSTPAQAPQVPLTEEQIDGFLCRAWGETDLPCAEVVQDVDGIRRFMVREWLGNVDSQDADGTNSLENVMREFAEHDWSDDSAFAYEFEIGGVSVERVYSYRAHGIGAATGETE
ncbi:MAG: hypothetical protein V4669_13970 [Pseudomonadota bacterium]